MNWLYNNTHTEPTNEELGIKPTRISTFGGFVLASVFFGLVCLGVSFFV